MIQRTEKPILVQGVNPRLKQYRLLEGMFTLSNSLKIAGGPRKACLLEAGKLAARMREITGLRITAGKTGAAIRMRLVARLPESGVNPEGYRIRVAKPGIEIESPSDRGLFYGGVTLCDMLCREGVRWGVAACELNDWPDFAWRHFTLDCVRKFVPVGQIIQYLDWMALNKLNIFRFNFACNAQYALEMPQWPELNERLHGPAMQPSNKITANPFKAKKIIEFENEFAGVYSRTDVRRIVAYAMERKIEVLPVIHALGNSAPVVNHFDLFCRTGFSPHSGSGQRPSWSIMCPGNKRSEEIVAALFDDILPLFPFDRVLMPSDELAAPVRPWVHYSWDRCEVCRSYMKRKKLRTMHDLFFDFIRRVHKLLAERDKRMIIANDFIDSTKPIPLPRDIAILFWRIADKAWPIGPQRGSMAAFARAGFPIINQHGPSTYLVQDAVSDRRLTDWHPQKRPPIPKGVRDKIIGGGIARFYRADFNPRADMSAMAFFADRVWNRAPVKDLSAYARLMARHMFGPFIPPALEDVFEALGSIVPPLIVHPPQPRVLPDEECTLPGRMKRTRKDNENLCRAIQRSLRDPRLRCRETLKEYLVSLKQLTQ